jgi:basic amino acid/polyamine antiporter, APA family
VFISYGGLTKIVALSEEVKNPGRNLPLGMILALAFTSIFYILVIYVTIGVMNPDNLRSTLVPISDGALIFGGSPLQTAISIGALLAFISTANAGIMTASRYPLGMSRDKLLPMVFQRISRRFKTPYISILATGFFMVTAILFLDLELLVKIASSVLILLYIFANLTLILFRESRILSYRPKFKSPLYPFMQIIGVLGGVFLLIEMGSFILFVTGIFLFAGVLWYKVYAQKRSTQDSALIYALEKLVAKDKGLASEGLLSELKDVVIQRDGIIEDRFHRLVEESKVLDIEQPIRSEDLFREVSMILSKELGLSAEALLVKFSEREEQASTVLRKGLAIPHIIVEGKNIFKVFLIRAKAGVIFPDDNVAHIIFIFVGSLDERNLHLKSLAAIAQITQQPEFDKIWLTAGTKEQLRNIILLADRRRA